MRAVNLIPAELRRAGSTGGRSGNGAFIVLGALALLVAMVTLYTLTNRTVAGKQARLVVVEQQAAAAESRTANLKAYTEFSALSKQRTETVKSLAASRFEWARALTDVARVLPRNAWLSSMRATVTPGVSIDGASDPMRQSLAVPAIELAGCTTSQASVARIVADLRAADGVKRVSLSSANKSDVVVAATTSRSTTDSGSAGAGTDCTQGNANRPKFSLTIFYDAPANPATATPTTTTPATTASGTSTTAGSTSTPTSTTGG